MLPQQPAIASANQAVLQRPRTSRDEVRVLSGRNETDLLAVLFLCDGQPQPPSLVPDRWLVEGADRKPGVRELVLGQCEQEVGLILGAIDTAKEPKSTGRRILLDPGVVAGC